MYNYKTYNYTYVETKHLGLLLEQPQGLQTLI